MSNRNVKRVAAALSRLLDKHVKSIEQPEAEKQLTLGLTSERLHAAVSLQSWWDSLGVNFISGFCLCFSGPCLIGWFFWTVRKTEGGIERG